MDTEKNVEKPGTEMPPFEVLCHIHDMLSTIATKQIEGFFTVQL